MTGTRILLAKVEDNGRGFTYDAERMPARLGPGLLGIRERAAIAGGSVVIDSAPRPG